jgi:hypothetical protein
MGNTNYYSKNKDWWEKMVAEKNGFTQPWLDLDPVVVRQYADGELIKVHGPLAQIYPQSVLKSHFKIPLNLRFSC